MHSDVKQTEDTIRDLEERIQRVEALERLNENRDFKVLIRDTFMRDESLRYLEVSADTTQNDVTRRDALAIAQAASHLKRFMAATMALGMQSRNQIQEHRELLDQLRAEEA